jgi:hypothetical protein
MPSRPFRSEQRHCRLSGLPIGRAATQDCRGEPAHAPFILSSMGSDSISCCVCLAVVLRDVPAGHVRRQQGTRQLQAVRGGQVCFVPARCILHGNISVGFWLISQRWVVMFHCSRARKATIPMSRAPFSARSAPRACKRPARYCPFLVSSSFSCLIH